MFFKKLNNHLMQASEMRLQRLKKIRKRTNRGVLNHLWCLLISLLFLSQVVAQDFIKRPQTITTEGVPEIPSFIKSRFDKQLKWNASFILGWSSKGLLAFSDVPYLVHSPNGVKEKIPISLFDQDEFELQPIKEKYILFTKDNNGDEVTQLFQYDIDSKEERQLTNSNETEFVSSFLWSADGNAIYLTNRKQKENVTEFCLFDPENRKLKILASLKGDTKYLITINQNYLVFRDFLSNNNVKYYLMDLKTYEIKQLTFENAYVKEAKFSRNNALIWWLSNKSGNFFDLYCYDLKTQKTKKFNPNPLNLSDFEISPNEKNIALKINENGTERLRLYQLNKFGFGKEIQGPQLPEGIVGNIQWRNNNELGFSFESFKSPSEVFSFDVTTQKLEKWVAGEVNQNLVKNVGEATLIRWNSFDKREITGFIVKPRNVEPATKIPVIIDIHGGPKSQFQPEFDPYSCYFVTELKVAKVFPNIRGSSGFGREFEELDNKEKRENAVKDLQFLLDWIRSQPDLDEDKVFVTGSSYGSFMALALGLKEPNRLKGIVAESPLVSIKGDALTSSEKIRETNEPEYGSLKDVKLMEQLERLSVLGNDLNSWQIPVLLAIGKNDTRVPPEDVRKFHRSLLSTMKESWLIEASDEGHNWNNWNNTSFLYYSEYAFYKKHLF